MQPHEIKPDTELCTILGYNAQTGYARRYFNRILKHYGVNATAIALNIGDEHFDYTMRNVAKSKVDKMIIEREFAEKSLSFCDEANETAKCEKRIDFIEVKEGRIYGYCLDDEVEALFDTKAFLDDKVRFIAKMMLIAARWYDTPIDIDLIPELSKE